MMALVIALCIASAILGRLVLTADEARRTVTVRLPALLLLIVAIAVTGLFLAYFAAACFVGGSFYGLGKWWWPACRGVFVGLIYDLLLPPIATGSWE